MAEVFDAYHRWLGISPREQPPNHYRLLGIPLFEEDPDVVEGAADRQMAHLRHFQTGQHGRLSQELLNEVAAAKLCLLNHERKAAYDRTLREELQEAEAERPPMQPNDSAGEAGPMSSGGFVRRRLPLLAAGLGVVVVAAVGLSLAIPDQRTARESVDEGVATAPSPGDSDSPIEETVEEKSSSSTDREPATSDGMSEEMPTEGLNRAATEAREPTDSANPPADNVNLSPDSRRTTDPGFGPRRRDARPRPSPPAKVKQPKTPQPIPSQREQEEIAQQIDEVYHVKQCESPTDKLELAKRLLKVAAETKGTPAQYFVLLRTARDLATEGGDAVLMLEAVDAIQADSVESTPYLRKQSIEKYIEAGVDSTRIGSLIEAARKVVGGARANNKYEEVALPVVEMVYKACLGAAGTPHRKEVYDLRLEIKHQYEAWKEFNEASRILEANFADPEANLIAGRWYWFHRVGRRGTFERGSPYVAKGSDASLSALARQELKPPTDPTVQVELADAWYDLAKKTNERQAKKRMLLRARFWHRKAQPKITDPLASDKITKRLNEIEELLNLTLLSPPAEPPAIPAQAPVSRGPTSITRRIVFAAPEALDHFVLHQERAGSRAKGNAAAWIVDAGKMVLASQGDRVIATYKEHYSTISSVAIRGGIVPPNKSEFRVVVGPIGVNLNWLAGSNRFMNTVQKGNAVTLKPALLTPGIIHDIRVVQNNEQVVVLVDGVPRYTTRQRLEGTVSVYTVKSQIAVQEIVINGVPDPGVEVRGPSHDR